MCDEGFSCCYLQCGILYKVQKLWEGPLPKQAGAFLMGAAKGGGDMASKYDWAKIEKEYVEGIVNEEGNVIYPSMPDLAKKYSCALSTVGRRASLGQWSVKRERFANKVGKERQGKKTETLSDEAAKFDLSCFNISQGGVEKVKGLLEGCTKPGDFAALTKALKDLQAVAKTAIGDGGGQSNELSIEVRLTDED